MWSVFLKRLKNKLDITLTGHFKFTIGVNASVNSFST